MYLENSKRIVLKIGSALITDKENGKLKEQWLASLVDDIAAFHKQGKEVILVTSGSVALGWHILKIKKRSPKLEEKQAAAACGQIELIRGFKEFFASHNISVAQILLTIEDSENRKRYLNARSTLETLLKMGIVPIINENDTVATASLRFGDNDRLAARVAQMTGSDVLVLLSDIDGLYTANPQTDDTAKFVPLIEDITEDIEAMAGTAVSGVGTGGMITKIAAAKIAVSAGCHMAITAGKPYNPLQGLLNGAKASWFISSANPLTARKHWIAASLYPMGEVTVDDGALKALMEGKSLLPAGVTHITGDFNQGDAVCVKDSEGNEIGIGIATYSAQDAHLIMGKRSLQIKAILGFAGRPELIHRDDLVIQQ